MMLIRRLQVRLLRLSIVLVILTTALSAPTPNSPSALAQSVHSDKESFIESARRGDLEGVKSFLDSGLDPNTRDPRDKENSTVLMVAAMVGQTKVIELLLDHRADVDARTNHGRTALMWGAWRGRNEAVKALLAKGADINAVDDAGVSALFLSIGANQPAVVKTLVANGARTDITPESSRSLWGFALHSKCNECIEALLDGRTDVNAKDRFGRTPLMLAVDAGRLDAMKILLAKGADVHVQDFDYHSALTRARKRKDPAIIQLLLDYGAGLPDTNKRSWP